MAHKKGDKIQITLSQGSTAKDISDAIGQFLEDYDKKKEDAPEEEEEKQ